MKRKIIFLLGILFFVALKAEASFSVSPMAFYPEIPAGKSQTFSFQVRNRGEETINLKFYLADFWINSQGKELFLEPGKVSHSCSKWIKLAYEKLELAAGESRFVRFTISVPKRRTGTYWGMIFVEQTSKPTLKTVEVKGRKFNITFLQRIGIRIYQNNPGTGIVEGKISYVEVKEGESLKVKLKFQNTGNTLLKCKGRVEIRNENGETVETLDLGYFSVYPEGERDLEASINGKLKKGQYTALVIIDFGSAEYLVAGERIFNIK